MKKRTAYWVCQDFGNTGFGTTESWQINANADLARRDWACEVPGSEAGKLHHQKMTNVPYFNNNAWAGIKGKGVREDVLL